MHSILNNYKEVYRVCKESDSVIGTFLLAC